MWANLRVTSMTRAFRVGSGLHDMQKWTLKSCAADEQIFSTTRRSAAAVSIPNVPRARGGRLPRAKLIGGAVRCLRRGRRTTAARRAAAGAAALRRFGDAGFYEDSGPRSLPEESELRFVSSGA